MSDDENEDSIPQLEDLKNRELSKLEDINNQIKQLKQQLALRKKRLMGIKADIDLFESGTKQSVFYLEKIRSGRMTVWWLLMVMLTLFCTFGTFSTKTYLLSFVNFVGFLVVWRKLYVDTGNVPLLIALAIVVATIYFL